MIPENLQLTRLPFAISYRAQDFGDKITLSSRLRSAVDGILDGEPMILPTPKGGPVNVPRIQLESSDKSYVLQVAQERLTLEWNRRSQQPRGWAETSEEVFKAIGGIVRVFVGEYAQPQGFAINPQFIFNLKQSANAYLETQLFAPGRLVGAPYSCRLSLVDQVEIEGGEYQLSFNIASARDRQHLDRDTALVIQFDLRPANQDARGIGGEDIMKGLAGIEALMSERLEKTFGDLFDSD